MNYGIPIVNKIDDIVMEASTSDDRSYMRKMSKDDINQINATLIQKLYASVLEHKRCDFGDIPKSNGDITKVKYYKSTIECLDVLAEIFEKNGITEPALSDIRLAISNVANNKRQFEYGFKTKIDYMIIMYNTTVMAIIDATSMLIVDYMNYIVGPNQDKYVNSSGRFDKSRGTISIDNLRKFNTLVKNGTFSTACNHFIKNGDDVLVAGTNVVTEGLGAVILISVGALASIRALIVLIREMIYYIYHSRVSLSDYLESQAALLEMNRYAIENSKRPASQKKEIIKKQESVILKLHRISDKLKINAEDTTELARKKIKEDNSTLSLGNIEQQLSTNKLNGTNPIQFI